MLVLTSGFLLFALSGCDDPPICFSKAEFEYVVQTDGEGYEVQFENFSVNADRHHWDFGNGTTSTEENPVHVYSEPGDYTVTLTVGCEENENQFSISLTEDDFFFDSVRDHRDGNQYPVIKIGDRFWMAQNLAYRVGQSPCYDHSSSNCTKFGRLYPNSLLNGLCPEGWHIPSRNEWEEAIALLGGSTVAGSKMKAVDARWGADDQSDNSSGFSAVPGGIAWFDGSEVVFSLLDIWASFWASTPSNAPNTYVSYRLTKSWNEITEEWGDENFYFSCRCIKD